MKIKNLLFLPLLLSTITLSSCNEEQNKINLLYGQQIKNDVTYVDYQQIKEKFLKHETFIVTVFANNCRCWSDLHSILKQYISNYHIEVFAISYNDFLLASKSNNDNVFDLNIVSGSTTFAVVENGKLRFNELNTEKTKMLRSYNAFEEFMNDLVILPKMFYIDLDQLNELFETDKTSLIYFSRSNCSDCLYFNDYFLRNYQMQKNMYILDCESIGVREYDGEGNLTSESATKWQEFKDNYYLSNVNNKDYGYDTGYVPTLLLFNGNSTTKKPTFISGAIYFNDELAKENDEYIIKNSYYTEERKSKLPYLNNVENKVLVGTKIDENNITVYGEYISWNKIDASKYHDPLVKAFLDDANNKINHDKFLEEE